METAIIIGLNNNLDSDFYESLEELKNLAYACQIEVIEQMVQKRDNPTSRFYIGKGKVTELESLITIHEPDMVIFDDELSPSQIKNLEKELDVRVIDRTVLILDIFARRAKTTEAKLQVELAQARYLLPRMIGSYGSLSRQRAGTGSKGPGEQKLELDRRVLRKKISQIKIELNKVVETRRTQRKNRKNSQIPIVSLTGYTNAGKSSIMNALIDESEKTLSDHTFEKDMLFATLETKTKRISLHNHKDFLLTDTVGFIKKLPHDLIEAFKSTLEEISEADLLLHVIDVSVHDYPSQIETVNLVLDEIGASDIPTLYVLNKVDKLENRPLIDFYPHIFVSAKEKTNINQLLNMINRLIEKETSLVTLLIPFNKGELFSIFKTNKSVQSYSYENEGILLKVRLTQDEINYYQKYIYTNYTKEI